MNIELSKSIKETDDFYNHVNMNWINKSSIPSDNMMWNVFNELNENNMEKIHHLINFLKKSNNIDTDFMKVIVLYNQSYNIGEGFSPSLISCINNIIRSINSAKNPDELRQILVQQFILNGISSPNKFYVYNNFNDSTTNILHIGTGGLGLPDRDYYFNDNMKDIIEKYISFIKKYLDCFKLDFDISAICKIEELLASTTYTNVMKRNNSLMNNLHTMEEIKESIPYLYDDLIYFFKEINVTPGLINIINPQFTIFYYKLLYTADLKTLKEYYIYLFLRKMGDYINTSTQNEIFNFYEMYLSGVKEQKPAWKRSVLTINNMVGMLVGKMFVKEYFNENNKKKVIYMIKFIKEELKNRLKANTWMDSSTIQHALEKLEHMNFKVGYPDVWKDYSSLLVSDTNNYLENILNCYRFELKHDTNDLYKKIDREQWFMNPQEINAYYSPSYNEIVFPCGILQEPFFSVDMDIAYNFGGIGCIIGHEITHGFDDHGREFDAYGNFKNWWTESDIVKYKEKSNILKKMFDKLKLYNENVNGELTLGENIADLGGVEISFNSLKKYYDTHPEEFIKSLSYKRFFYNYANIWRYLIRKEEALKRLITDVHTPPYYRVNTILGNVNQFYEHFDIVEGSKMWLDVNDRANVW